MIDCVGGASKWKGSEMPTTAERNAAFGAVHELVMRMVPAMFQSYITTVEILEIADAALNAAEKVRVQQTSKPTP